MQSNNLFVRANQVTTSINSASKTAI